MDRTCKTLSFNQILRMNRQMIDAFGGSFYDVNNNLLNEDSLRFILEALDSTTFGMEMYPTIERKAAVLGWSIITKHIFQDGNKRTGIIASQIFLEINGYDLPLSISEEFDAEAIDAAIAIATNEMSLDGFTDWIKSRIQPIRAKL